MTTIYAVPVTLTFQATVYFRADSQQQAAHIAKQDWSAVLDNAHTSNDQHVLDWDVDTHPETTIGTIRS